MLTAFLCLFIFILSVGIVVSAAVIQPRGVGSVVPGLTVFGVCAFAVLALLVTR